MLKLLKICYRLLEEANEEFLTLSWRGGGGRGGGENQEDGEDDVFFSLIFSPCGYVVFELISDTLDPGQINVVEHPNPRFLWQKIEIYIPQHLFIKHPSFCSLH